MDIRNEFIRIATDNIHRGGLTALINWMGQTDFFTAPASTKYHGACESGLVLHSMNVYTELTKLADWYGLGPDDGVENIKESIAIVSLFHDICKIGCYKTEMRWRKDANDKWEQYPVYTFKEDYPFGGHGSKSVYLLQNFIKLTPIEAAAINCHMGAWDKGDYSNPAPVYDNNKLAWLLHVADEADTYLRKE